MIVLTVAAAAAPATRKPPAWTVSCRHEAQNAGHRLPTDTSDRRGSLIHSGRPSRSQSQPMVQAATMLATPLATTIIGLPGNATAVAVRTMGLIAGAASRNANAAAGVIPRRTKAPAIGTEPHSQPGSTTPAAEATGTARTGRLGSSVAKADGGT